jgi:hypothetical protein
MERPICTVTRLQKQKKTASLRRKPDTSGKVWSRFLIPRKSGILTAIAPSVTAHKPLNYYTRISHNGTCLRIY